MPSMRAAFSLSSFSTFKAFWMASFSKTARRTILRPPPEREAVDFFLVDLRIVFLATRILLSFVVLPNAVFELRKYASEPLRSCAVVRGVHPAHYAQAGNLLRLQA